MRKAWILSISLLAVLVLLIGMGVVACGGGNGEETALPTGEEEEEAPTPPAPGEWVASIDLDYLKFTVTPDGTGISEISYRVPSEFLCDGDSLPDVIGKHEFTINPLPIFDSQFELTRSFTVPHETVHWDIVIQGEFDETGTHASGTWEISADGTTCVEGTWVASPD